MPAAGSVGPPLASCETGVLLRPPQAGGGPVPGTVSSIFTFDTAVNDIYVDGPAAAMLYTGVLDGKAQNTSVNYQRTITTGKTYMEFVVFIVQSTAPWVNLGWEQDVQSPSVSPNGFGIRWNGATSWTFFRSAQTSSNITITNPVRSSGPQTNDTFGIAVDWDNNKLYVNWNGTWMENTTYGGGDPAGGNGIDIIGASDRILWPSVSIKANGTTVQTQFRAIAPYYQPAGYTSIT